MHTLNSSHAEFYKKAASIAHHYGFLSFDELLTIKAPSKEPNTAVSLTDHKKLDPLGGEFAVALAKTLEKRLLPSGEPLLLYTTNLEKDNVKAPKIIRFNLFIFGSKQSITEALILKAGHAILEENGIRSMVRLNSIGDRDSSAKFARDAGAYLGKHAEEIPPQARDTVKDDSIAVLRFLVRKRHPLYLESPRPVEFLTNQSRKHLREVIEFVETAGIPYEIDDFLLGNRDAYSQTLFEIHPVVDDDSFDTSQEPPEPYALGGRLDELSKRIAKTGIPSVSLSIIFKSPETTPMHVASPIVKYVTKKPKICFIHVGFEAKLKSIAVIEVFRKARIPFYQCLHHDRLTEQLAYAERLSVPFTVIMGQKEALDGMVIIRNTSSRAQQTVSIELLPSFFKQQINK